MKPVVLYGSLSAVALVVWVVATGSGDARNKGFSLTEEVVIDGTRFLADDSPSNDSTRLRRELERLGVHPGESFDLPDDPAALRPLFSGKLARPSNSRTVGAPSVPNGLTADHSLRLSGERHNVDLVSGRQESPGRPAASRLEAEGWKPLSPADSGGRARMFEHVRGKESAVVFLDETEGRFLLFRKLER